MPSPTGMRWELEGYPVRVRLRAPADTFGFGRKLATTRMWVEDRFGADSFATSGWQRHDGGEFITVYFLTLEAAQEAIELFGLPVAAAVTDWASE